jgi:hypothetical protein
MLGVCPRLPGPRRGATDSGPGDRMVRMECILDKCDKSAAFATFLLNLNLAIDVGCRRRDLDLTLV